MPNPFDQFDTAPAPAAPPAAQNPFDAFDGANATAIHPALKAPRYGDNPILNYMADKNTARFQELADSDARRDANKADAPPILQPAADFMAPLKGGLQALKDRATATAPQGGAVREFLHDPLGLVRAGKDAGAAIGLIASPIIGAANQIVNPVARVGERMGMNDAELNAKVLNTSLAGARGGLPIARAPGPLADTVAAFERAKVAPRLVTVAGGKGKVATTNFVAENALAGGRTRAALQSDVQAAGASANRIASGYGTVRGPQITGENVQAGVNRFAKSKDVAGDVAAPAANTSFAAKAGALYDDAFAPINEAEAAAVDKATKFHQGATDAATQTRADLMAEREALIARTQEDAKLESGRRGYEVKPEPVPEWNIPDASVAPPVPVVKTGQTSATLNALGTRVNAPALSSIINDPRLSTIAKALESDPSSVRFGDLRELRTWVRTAQKDPALRQGMDQAGLQQLEGALTTDIYDNAAHLAGPEALSKLRRVDQYYAAGSQRIQHALESFDAANSGESAYRRIIQAAQSGAGADAQKVLALKRSLHPEEWGDIAANSVAELGKPVASAAGVGEDFSVNTFLTNYNKMSPRAREVMFGSVGGGGEKASGLKAELDNLAFVAGKLKTVEKGANVSKSGVSLQNGATYTGLGSAAVAAFSGNFAPLAGALGALGTAAGAGELMTNPGFVRWLARTPSNPALMADHVQKLNALAANNAAISNFRDRLMVGHEVGNGQQPVGYDVPAPRVPAPPPMLAR